VPRSLQSHHSIARPRSNSSSRRIVSSTSGSGSCPSASSMRTRTPGEATDGRSSCPIDWRLARWRRSSSPRLPAGVRHDLDLAGVAGKFDHHSRSRCWAHARGRHAPTTVPAAWQILAPSWHCKQTAERRVDVAENGNKSPKEVCASPVHHGLGIWGQFRGIARRRRNRMVEPSLPVRRLLERIIRLTGLPRKTPAHAGVFYMAF
jgi:hypothetical protein